LGESPTLWVPRGDVRDVIDAALDAAIAGHTPRRFRNTHLAYEDNAFRLGDFMQVPEPLPVHSGRLCRMGEFSA